MYNLSHKNSFFETDFLQRKSTSGLKGKQKLDQ